MAARAFYQDVLRGQQVWPTEHVGTGSTWFLVGGTLVEVAPDRDRAAPPVVLDARRAGARGVDAILQEAEVLANIGRT